jgi:dTDP-4-dehydrorhamnose reductase
MISSNQFKVPKALVTGGSGQLATRLVTYLKLNNIPYESFSKNQLDILDNANLKKIFNEVKPNIIINCAAYTNVAEAETNKESCFKVNVIGITNLVKLCKDNNCKLLQISTDYVFDGNKEDGIYYENDIKNPLNYYGYSKSLAEDIVINNLMNYVIIRTSWLYGNSKSDFVSKILSLSLVHENIYVTNKEFGSPTYVDDLCEFIVYMLGENLRGTFHFSNKGKVSRFEFATRILELFDIRTNIIPLIEQSNNLLRPSRVFLRSSKNNEIQLKDWYLSLSTYISNFNSENLVNYES